MTRLASSRFASVLFPFFFLCPTSFFLSLCISTGRSSSLSLFPQWTRLNLTRVPQRCACLSSVRPPEHISRLVLPSLVVARPSPPLSGPKSLYPEEGSSNAVTARDREREEQERGAHESKCNKCNSLERAAEEETEDSKAHTYCPLATSGFGTYHLRLSTVTLTAEGSNGSIPGGQRGYIFYLFSSLFPFFFCSRLKSVVARTFTALLRFSLLAQKCRSFA